MYLLYLYAFSFIPYIYIHNIAQFLFAFPDPYYSFCLSLKLRDIYIIMFTSDRHKFKGRKNVFRETYHFSLVVYIVSCTRIVERERDRRRMQLLTFVFLIVIPTTHHHNNDVLCVLSFFIFFFASISLIIVNN